MRKEGTGSLDTTEQTSGRGARSGGRRDWVICWADESGYAGLRVLREASLRIGRGFDSHIRLDRSSLSRQHAELYRQGPIFALRDLGSTNGTYLNAKRIEHAAISSGDVVRAGSCVLIVSTLGESDELVGFGEIATGLWGGTALASAVRAALSGAKTDIPVVVQGETGTGKERVAHAIHAASGRSGRFHAINCAALPATLAEAELFGYERGAFTGAERSRMGHLRAAHEGTLFLDEVAELPLAIQAKLLRALEERAVTPLGATDSVPIDARLVVAAQQPLQELVERKLFRADLCARLAGFQATLPPLRERREDIPGLFWHLLAAHGAKSATVDAKLLERLCVYDWPGNVRELELLVRKLVALHADAPVLALEHAETMLPSPVRDSSEALEGAASPVRERREHDLLRLQAALEKNGGKLGAAAASVGISRWRAHRLLDATKAGDVAADEDNS